MADEEVKLFGYWASPFSKRVETALKMKGINYKYSNENLWNKSPELLKYNPVYRKVPVPLHNNKPICESLIILEYIDDTWKSGPSILLKDPYDKTIARFWSRFIDDKYMISARKDIDSSLEFVIQCIPAIYKVTRSEGEEQEKAKNFFGGEDIGVVDIAANMIALWLVVLQDFLGTKLLTKEKFPRLCEWIEDHLNCSIIKQTLPSTDDLVKYFRSVFPSAE